MKKELVEDGKNPTKLDDKKDGCAVDVDLLGLGPAAKSPGSTKRKEQQTPPPPDEKKLKIVSPINDLLTALQESRLADTENKDHLDIRVNAVKALEGEDKSELENISKPGEWTTRTHWTLIRKALLIGFNVFSLDGLGLKFKFTDPADEPNENHAMVNLLFDGVHYDLVTFGKLSNENLMGFVSSIC